MPCEAAVIENIHFMNFAGMPDDKEAVKWPDTA